MTSSFYTAGMEKPLLAHGSLPDAETAVRILVRHLPTFLSEDALKEFFLHYGIHIAPTDARR